MKSFAASATAAGLQVQGTAFQSPAVGAGAAAAAGLPHYAIQQGIPYNVYG